MIFFVYSATILSNPVTIPSFWFIFIRVIRLRDWLRWFDHCFYFWHTRTAIEAWLVFTLTRWWWLRFFIPRNCLVWQVYFSGSCYRCYCAWYLKYRYFWRLIWLWWLGSSIFNLIWWSLILVYFLFTFFVFLLRRQGFGFITVFLLHFVIIFTYFICRLFLGFWVRVFLDEVYRLMIWWDLVYHWVFFRVSFFWRGVVFWGYWVFVIWDSFCIVPFRRWYLFLRGGYWYSLYIC